MFTPFFVCLVQKAFPELGNVHKRITTYIFESISTTSTSSRPFLMLYYSHSVSNVFNISLWLFHHPRCSRHCLQDCKDINDIYKHCRLFNVKVVHFLGLGISLHNWAPIRKVCYYGLILLLEEHLSMNILWSIIFKA